jgi:hypothetical protein
MSDGKLLELAERCEKASPVHGDLSLLAIAVAGAVADGEPRANALNATHGDVNAALGLVRALFPEGQVALVQYAHIWWAQLDALRATVSVHAATPALALVAATLRALATGQDTSVGAASRSDAPAGGAGQEEGRGL